MAPPLQSTVSALARNPSTSSSSAAPPFTTQSSVPPRAGIILLKEATAAVAAPAPFPAKAPAFVMIRQSSQSYIDSDEEDSSSSTRESKQNNSLPPPPQQLDDEERRLSFATRLRKSFVRPRGMSSGAPPAVVKKDSPEDVERRRLEARKKLGL